MLPWRAAGPGGTPLHLSLGTLRELLSGAFAVAMLGGIESLLSAVIADGMAGTKHDPDAELLALGIGNVVTPFFGGIPATGAIARTATNFRSGARSPIASIVHAMTVLVAVIVLAPLIGYLPMAGLAALLLLVAWNMAEPKHFAHILRVAPRSDVFVLLTCFVLTIVFDMVVAVSVGVVLAALLFMRRMAEITQAHLVGGGEIDRTDGAKIPVGSRQEDRHLRNRRPPVLWRRPESRRQPGRRGRGLKVMIVRLEKVPVMDATGLVALESAIATLTKDGCLTILVGLQSQPSQLIERAGLKRRPWRLEIRPDLAAGLAVARELV